MSKIYSVIASIGNENYRTAIKSGSHEIIADEKTEDGGKDLGMEPTSLLASALASCICITLHMYANRKQWEIGSVTVKVEVERKETGTHFTKEIHFSETLAPEVKERLLAVAEKCPVHKTLSGPIHFQSNTV